MLSHIASATVYRCDFLLTWNFKHIAKQTFKPELPALITHAGQRAAWRFFEFFTVNICNKNTRVPYSGRACA